MVKDSNKKIGEVLPVNEEYLRKAFDAINILIFAIIIEAAKLVKTDRNEYLQDIFTIAFDHLSEGRYYLCSKVYKSLMDSKYLDAMYRTMSTINYWISRIEMDGLDSVRSEINTFDVSALNPLFGLAKSVLLEDYDRAEAMISHLYKTEEINANMLETWPLFMNFRKTEQYERIKSAQAEDFKVATFEINTENERNDEGTNNSDAVPKKEIDCHNQTEKVIDESEYEALC